MKSNEMIDKMHSKQFIHTQSFNFYSVEMKDERKAKKEKGECESIRQPDRLLFTLTEKVDKSKQSKQKKLTSPLLSVHLILMISFRGRSSENFVTRKQSITSVSNDAVSNECKTKNEQTKTNFTSFIPSRSQFFQSLRLEIAYYNR